jgi:hypothetical protein
MARRKVVDFDWIWLGAESNRRHDAERLIQLIPNPLRVFEQNLLPAAVIKLGGPAVCVTGDSLSGFKGTVIFQKIRDAGRPK